MYYVCVKFHASIFPKRYVKYSPRYSILESRIVKNVEDVTVDGIKPTRLYSANNNVDQLNVDELAALPGVRSLDGLHILSLNPNRIKAHPKVLEFYKTVFG